MKRYGLLAVICVALAAVAVYVDHVTTYEQPLLLSEVCPHNQTVAYDRFGGYSDYIELYNRSDNSINLDGYYLSDSKDNLKLYRITDTLINPGEYMIFWCRKIDDSISPYVKDSDNICGFSLKDGETVYLSNPEAIVVDKVKLPRNTGIDMSYTRVSDNKWDITQASKGCEYVKPKDIIEINALPVFSNKSGFYDEEFELKISCESDPGNDYSIYYTLDSSDPGPENGMLYTDGISIKNISNEKNRYASVSDISVFNEYVPSQSDPVDKAVVVRAVCADKDGNCGQIQTATYFVGYGDDPAYRNMMVASLVTDPDNLFGYENGIYVTGKVWDDVKDDAEAAGYNYHRPPANYYLSGEGWKRKANIELFDENRQLCGSTDVKIGIMGQYSTCHSQKSFSLTALNEADILDGTASEGLLDGIIGYGATSLSLRAGGNKDVFATKVRDVFAQELVKDRNLGLQSAVPVQVFLDGEYWGLYQFQERIDAGYVASHYGIDADNLIVLKMENVMAGEESDLQLFEDVIKYAEEHNLSIQKYYDHMCELIDIQSFIDYNCLNIYIANTDSVTNNYAYWRAKNISTKPYCDGRWRWLVYDTDDSSGVVEDEMSEPDTDSFISGHWLDNPMDEPLLKNLMENPGFKDQFIRTFLDMADNDFAWDKLETELQSIEAEYSNAVVASMRRNYNPEYTAGDYTEAMNVLRRFYRERGSYIIDDMFIDLNADKGEYGR